MIVRFFILHLSKNKIKRLTYVTIESLSEKYPDIDSYRLNVDNDEFFNHHLEKVINDKEMLYNEIQEYYCYKFLFNNVDSLKTNLFFIEPDIDQTSMFEISRDIIFYFLSIDKKEIVS